MTITELFKRLKEQGYDNRHAEYYFLGAVNPDVRIQSGHTAKWHEDKLLKELEYDARRVFRMLYADAWEKELSQAHSEYRAGQIDFVIDYLLNT